MAPQGRRSIQLARKCDKISCQKKTGLHQRGRHEQTNLAISQIEFMHSNCRVSSVIDSVPILHSFPCLLPIYLSMTKYLKIPRRAFDLSILIIRKNISGYGYSLLYIKHCGTRHLCIGRTPRKTKEKGSRATCRDRSTAFFKTQNQQPYHLASSSIVITFPQCAGTGVG